MATPAEEAVSKAKAIAARFSGKSPHIVPMSETLDSKKAGTGDPKATGTSTNCVTGKRKRWGALPQSSRTAHNMLPGLADATKRLKETAVSATKRIWVSTSAERSERHYLAYLKPKLSSLLTELNDQICEGDPFSRRISVELKGRGSSRDPPLPGMPEEPMHVLISGASVLVNKAATLVDLLLSDADKAPVDTVDKTLDQGVIPIESGPADGGASAGTPLQKHTSTGYRPATVAQLIATDPTGMLGSGSADAVEEKIGVPNGVVGYLIGRGGETISSMQSRSGCKIQIQKEHELQPGQTKRVITLSAQTRESIDQCRGMIESMVEDRIRATGGGSAGSSMGNCVTNAASSPKENKVNDAIAAGHVLLRVKVPDADVGLIIGKSGTTIKNIQESTGASIQIPPSANADEPSVRTVSITHPSSEGAQMAKRHIEDLLKSKPSYSNYQGEKVSIQVLIPDNDVGLCIGRQGCVIREMQNKTNTRIQIPCQPNPNQSHRIATVVGSSEGCAQVRVMIDRIINEQSSASVMSSSVGQQEGHNMPVNLAQSQMKGDGQQKGLEKISAEWQAYYAAQELAKKQKVQLQQLSEHGDGSQPTSSGNLIIEGHYEQFFRYWYYYGEDAARKYYGVWSPPIGTRNPYGENPSRSVAPVVDANVEPSGGESSRAFREVRDSSVRKVSNLPAWMTREHC